ncbi:PREDICTED: probable pectinesterase/pectinesterase inhibitor 17 isoform X2 [Ipomoea nil]|uniref:probable pectinesterase/pectinesterase inhibitor 17 isoform X1 n=1 Tax=Ipomoea nil TaxID=35883 RepID=UPI0009013597|nr:PREDICTED: probable pectinesterase/pectinesterase inhibitor 17 isoform X1 [Ipomoea nil]XP_019189027.1 PREDICTED: probable pectinesterase/pectinesterase inhibitor 17 isoform X2 [Ipomoea nil]
MANLPLLFTCLFLTVFIFTTVSGYSPAEIKSWCSQTPYPQPCEYYLSRGRNNGGQIKDKTDFLNVAMEVALEHAMHEKANTYSLGTKCRNEQEKAAWEDCLELYENMVVKINVTVDPNIKCSAADAQTWLSTALTNMETCWAGFVDVGITGNIMPMMSRNVSYLISNTLAINKGYTGNNNEPTGYTDGFPAWTKPGDRKLLQSSAASKADVVVAQDGSGDYKTVTEAVNAAGKRSGSGRYVIYVKAGVYKENVNIGSKLKNIMMVGDGIGKTIITGSQSVGGGTTTFNSATVAVSGDGFIGQGITFRNTAGAANHQAVALRSGSDLSVFYQCSFEGYQDTLYVYSDRQFYRECDIYGTVDFIFGNAAAVFQNCNIYARNPPNKTNTITAQGRTDPNQNTGISIHNSKVTAASDLKGSLGSVKTYLGRPWQQYSRTVFMKTSLDSLIDPAGWLPWDGNFALNTLYYGEYSNTGAGASTANRVKWAGYHVITSATEASKFTVGNFIAGGSWLPATNVPFTSGL